MNNPFAIVISGSINSGKTSVSKELQKIVPELAHVEVDDLGAFIDWMPLEEQIPLNLKNAGLVSKVFLEAGISVVISYPLDRDEHAILIQALAPYRTHSFTLAPSLEIAQSVRGSRTLSSWEVARIAYHYQIGIPNSSFGHRIDNGYESAESTATRIYETIKEG